MRLAFASLSLVTILTVACGQNPVAPAPVSVPGHAASAGTAAATAPTFGIPLITNDPAPPTDDGPCGFAPCKDAPEPAVDGCGPVPCKDRPAPAVDACGPVPCQDKPGPATDACGLGPCQDGHEHPSPTTPAHTSVLSHGDR